MVEFTPYSSVKPWLGAPPTWYPEEHADRVGAYLKYDEIYWNDPTAYALRVLEGEEPIYIPNARVVADTTAHYLLKGLTLTVKEPSKNKATVDALSAFLTREMFYSRFHTAKHSGVVRGDFAFHMTADPNKPEGSRVSLTPIDPTRVIPIYDDDDIDKLLRVHIVDEYVDPKDPNKIYVHKLTYEYEFTISGRRVWREEAVFELEPKWFGPKPKTKQVLLPRAMLDPRITTIPVYWFKNLDWLGQEFGSSELRGFEKLIQAVSQQTTDQGAALSLEGLGVYATDGGRAVDDSGKEVDWEVAPGKVMEVPSGSYFRRVEGVGSLKPSLDHIGYVEDKLQLATGLSDVALGRIDVQTAQSGIALAIKFMPTLAKMEQRDIAGVERLAQLFFDWRVWMEIFEKITLPGEITPEIGQKLPADRTATINELNNMLDRGVISRAYYRQEMQKLGYEFPDDIEQQIEKEKTADAERAAKFAPTGLQQNAQDAASGEKPPPQSAGGAQNAPRGDGTNSNNSKKPNESKGTETGQTPERQAAAARRRS